MWCLARSAPALVRRPDRRPGRKWRQSQATPIRPPYSSTSFRCLAVEVPGVSMCAGPHVVSHTVTVGGWRLEGAQLQSLGSGVDDVVPGTGGHDHGLSRLNRRSDAVQHSLASSRLHSKELGELAGLSTNLFMGLQRHHDELTVARGLQTRLKVFVAGGGGLADLRTTLPAYPVVGAWQCPPISRDASGRSATAKRQNHAHHGRSASRDRLCEGEQSNSAPKAQLSPVVVSLASADFRFPGVPKSVDANTTNDWVDAPHASDAVSGSRTCERPSPGSTCARSGSTSVSENGGESKISPKDRCVSKCARAGSRPKSGTAPRVRARLRALVLTELIQQSSKEVLNGASPFDDMDGRYAGIFLVPPKLAALRSLNPHDHCSTGKTVKGRLGLLPSRSITKTRASAIWFSNLLGVELLNLASVSVSRNFPKSLEFWNL